ncbi:GDYXXLXY domain-containing protein [Psychrobacter sp. B38]|uniref:GDYXXLXY domain-containing protein n=1 Tax=Psychrobacter sp. B38 TaxID=3143538 RepID=UPI00320E74BE
MTVSHNHDATEEQMAVSLSDTATSLHRTPKPTHPWWQRRAVSITVAMLGLLSVLTFISLNAIKYETHLATGDTVLLALAPVDPRGFMQGDYMRLNYALEREILDTRAQTRNRDQTNEGYVVVALDRQNVGHFVRLADSHETALAANEMAIHYRLRLGSVKLATNAFFFQEGQAEAFEEAEYGQFRVNNQGEPLLTNLVNEAFDVIAPKK